MDRALIVVSVCFVVTVCTLAFRLRRGRSIARVVPSDFAPQSAGNRGVVLFSSPYCLTCQQWARDLSDAGIEYAQVDVAAEPALAARYRVTATPVVLAFDRGDGSVVWSSTDGPNEQRVSQLRALACDRVANAAAVGRRG